MGLVVRVSMFGCVLGLGSLIGSGFWGGMVGGVFFYV